MARFLILSLLLSIPVLGKSQSRDSLMQLIISEPDISKKAILWEQVADHDASNNRYDQSILAVKESIRLANLVDDEELLRDNYLKLANFYFEIGNKDLSLVYLRLHQVQAEYLQSKEVQDRILKLENLHALEVNALNEQITALQSEKKALTDDLARYQDELLGLRIAIVLTGLIAVALLIYILIRYYSKQGLLMSSPSGREVLQKNNDDSEILKGLKFQTEETAENLQYLMADILQTEHDLGSVFKSFFLYQKPQKKVGGDFFLVHSMSDKVMLSLVDCGPGLKGAAAALIVNGLLNHLVKESNITSPNMVLTLLEQQLQLKLNPKGDDAFAGIYITAALFNYENKELDVASCGQSLYHLDNGVVRELRINKLPLGNVNFKEPFIASETIPFRKDQIVILASNGFHNQLGGPNRKKFGKKGLIKLFESLKNQNREEQIYLIEKVYKDWKGLQDQTDDITIIGVTI